MRKVSDISQARSIRNGDNVSVKEAEGFTPCSQDMTICGDCEGNRSKQKCPRLKEWLAKKGI